MKKYNIYRKPRDGDSPDQMECQWLDTGLTVSANSAPEAIQKARRQVREHEFCGFLGKEIRAVLAR